MYVLEKLKPYAAQLGFLKSERMGKIFTLLYNTKEKVDIAASLPGTPEEVSQKSGYPLEVVKQIIKELHLKGAINEKVADKGAFRLFPGMIELRDATTLAPDTGVELLKLWDDLIRNELPQLLPAFEANGIPPMMRVIPIEETVESEGKVLDADSARAILRNAEKIVAIPCACRKTARALGKDKDCPAPKDLNLCLMINNFLQRGHHKGYRRGLNERGSA